MDSVYFRNTLHICDLPDEVLTLAFLAGTANWREESLHLLPFPLLVSGICRSWRFVAQNSPRLWVFVNPPIHIFKSVEQAERWTLQWISRSGVLPLSIVLDERLWTKFYSPNERFKEAITGVVRQALSHPHPLRRLDIWSDSFYIADIDLIFEASGRPAHLLQLTFCSLNVPRTFLSGQRNMDKWTQRLPNLRKLRFGGPSLGHIPRLNLTSLSVRWLLSKYSDIRLIFETCPDIHTLVLPELLPMRPPPPSDAPSVTVASLRSIAFSVRTQDIIFKMPSIGPNIFPLRFLDAPNLKYFEILGTDEITLASNLLLGSSKLETLRLANASNETSNSRPVTTEGQQLLRSLSHIRHLELWGTSTRGLLSNADSEPSPPRRAWFSSFLSSTLPADDPHPPTPQHLHWHNLTTITLTASTPDEILRLCRFTQGRHGLKTVHLSYGTVALLSELQRNGHVLNMADARWFRDTSITWTRDVEQWLRKKVNIETFKKSVGLLDREETLSEELN